MSWASLESWVTITAQGRAVLSMAVCKVRGLGREGTGTG